MIFDLLFILIVLASVATLLAAIVNAMRGRGQKAMRLLAGRSLLPFPIGHAPRPLPDRRPLDHPNSAGTVSDPGSKVPSDESEHRGAHP